MVACLLCVAFLAGHTSVFSPPAILAAETVPGFAVATSSGGWHTYAGSTYTRTSGAQYTVNDAVVNATVTNVGEDRWTLRIVQAKQTLTTVYFPWQPQRTPLDTDISDDVYYYPYLLGRTEKAANHDADWTWWGLPYPGSAAAPLVVMADPRTARIVAATNWPPKSVTPLYAAQRMVLRYDTTVPAGGVESYGALVATVAGNAAIGDVPWQKALDMYRKWLDASLGPVAYPSWMWEGQGLLDIQLEEHDSLASVDATWRANKTLYPWLLMWGHMSPLGGGCCGVDPQSRRYYANPRTMHSRWLSSGLPAWTSAVTDAGSHAAYYSAPYSASYGAPAGSPSTGNLDTPGGLNWLTSWIRLNASYGANSHYFDVFARDHFGDPASIVAFFGDRTLPTAALSEGVVDIYPIPGLVSGSLAGGGLCGAPHKTPDTQIRTSFPAFVRYLLGDRLIYWGPENDDHQFWGVSAHTDDTECDYLTYCAAGSCDNGVERQIHLTGARIAMASGAGNATLEAIVAERLRVNWWSRRPRYLGTKGLDLSSIPASSRVEVAHFRDINNASVLAISNPNLDTNLSVAVNGAAIAVPARKISILETNR